MRRYIDRAELFNSLANAKTVEEIFAAIQAALAADVQEVRHGRWELYDICSVCGAQAEQQTNYCPQCGARMDEGEDIPMEYFENGGI